MKKLMMVCVFLFALTAFAGASPWEGAAVTAPDGELPAKGFYVATNSFPRNTIVEITNIENNKSTRAIVANTLESPGLLAVVSREAGESIGLRSGSVGRIRMIQPSDPIAYLRFTEGLSAEISNYDSGRYESEQPSEDPYQYSAPHSAPPQPSPSVTTAPPLRQTPVPPPSAQTSPSAYYLEPEWGGVNSRPIIDLPEQAYGEQPAVNEVFDDYPGAQETAEESSPYTEEEIARSEDDETEDFEPVEIAEGAEEEGEPAQDAYIWYPVEDVKDEKTEVAENANNDIVDDPEGVAWNFPPEPEQEPEEVAQTAGEEAVEYPPEEVVWANDEEEIAEQPDDIPQAPVELANETEESETEIAQEEAPLAEAPLAEAPLAEAPLAEEPEYTLVPTEERPPQDIYGIDPSTIIPEVGAAREEPAPAPVYQNDPAFSIPRIMELNRGSYYVQLAAFDTPESVEKAVSGIDRNYEPKVFKDGDQWYRLLLGPLNQGESAAILQRFKSIGYKDAFVRAGK